MYIRSADMSDIADIMRLEKCCFSQPWSESSIAAQLEDEAGITLCAIDDDGNIAGYLMAGVVLDEISLWRVACAPELRRRGVGESLLRGLDTSEHRGFTVYLEVRVSNAPAIAMYRRHGYGDIGVRPRFYECPVEDALLMAYTIQ